MNKLLYELIGWYGAIAILVAYALVTSGTILPDTLSNHLLNLSGGIALTIYTIIKRVPPEVCINVVWSLIALGALYYYLAP